LVGTAKGDAQLCTLFIHDPARDLLLLATPIVITGLMVAPGETAARILADLHRRFPVEAQAFDAA
jgi:hypothetical protein